MYTISVFTPTGYEINVELKFWSWLVMNDISSEWREEVDNYLESGGDENVVYYNIDDSFAWDETTEGLVYWSDLHEQHTAWAIANAKPPNPHKFKEVI